MIAQNLEHLINHVKSRADTSKSKDCLKHSTGRNIIGLTKSGFCLINHFRVVLE